jgi:hypothetical protein
LILDYLFLSNPAAAAAAIIQSAGIVLPVLELELERRYRRSTFNPAALQFDVLNSNSRLFPPIHTLFPRYTPDPGKTRSRGRRILYLLFPRQG